MGLVNWVCAPGDLDATVERLIAKVRSAAPTATVHTKRLLHESYHRDPRLMIEEVIRAQNACMATWETAEANRAWQEKRKARYHPKP
jgi:enoyl-CoA hydratase/carnithine racemase